MTDIDRRKFLMGTAAIAAAAAVPSSLIYETETFQEAERLGLITGSPFCGATMNDWRMATAEEILADVQRALTVMMQAEEAPFARRFSAFVLGDA